MNSTDKIENRDDFFDEIYKSYEKLAHLWHHEDESHWNKHLSEDIENVIKIMHRCLLYLKTLDPNGEI